MTRARPLYLDPEYDSDDDEGDHYKRLGFLQYQVQTICRWAQTALALCHSFCHCCGRNRSSRGKSPAILLTIYR